MISGSPGLEAITIGDKRRLIFEYIGDIDVGFHGYTDERVTLFDVSYGPVLFFNLYLAHAVQRIQIVVSSALCALTIGTNVTFPRNTNGSYLRATRLPAITVEA